MSDFRAIATVTAALQRLLQAAVGVDVPGALAWTDRPEAHHNGEAGGPGVNIYAYQVVPDPSLRNDDLPTRGPTGTLVRRPQAALAVHYLLTFYGDDGELEPQRVLGSAVRTLHARPVITRELIGAVTDAATGTHPIHPSLADSDLASQVDVVRVCPLTLNLEELSKLWSVFFQVPYALSVAYQASVVLIEEPLAPAGGLPVLRPEVTLGVLTAPRVRRAESLTGGPVTVRDTLAVRGERLATGTPTVQIGPAALAPGSTAPDLLTVDLSTVAGLRAGTVPVRVSQAPLGERSTVVTFVLHPVLDNVEATGTAASGTVDLDTDPPLGAAQAAVLSLGTPGTGEQVRVFPVPARTADTGHLSVATGAVPPGTYAVLLSVDGADSLPGPEVTLP